MLILDNNHQDFFDNFFANFPDSQLKYSYESFSGFAIAIGTQDAFEYLRSHDKIESVEYELIGEQTATQKNAPWNLARISQRKLSNLNYKYSDKAGAGVDVYILDSGFRRSHDEFEERAIWGASFTGEEGLPNGHGTHVAAIVAGKKFGVAKKATVISVRVIDRNGDVFESDLIAGIEWSIKKKSSRKRRSVMNLSLIFPSTSRSVNAAIKTARNAGFIVTVSAGNQNVDACTRSPANSPDVITVGATIPDDRRHGAFGSCLTVFAPGYVESAWHTSDNAKNTLLGTSQAAPHVAGVAALVLAERSADITAFEAEITSYATRNVIKNAGSKSPNRMLYNNPPARLGEDEKQRVFIAE